MFCSDVNAIVCCAGSCVVGATRVASKLRGLNIKKWLQLRKDLPLGSRFERVFTVRRPMSLLGKADVAGEVTGACNLPTVVVGAQASQERLAEITSGRGRRQQGLVATCKDSRNEAVAEGG